MRNQTPCKCERRATLCATCAEHARQAARTRRAKRKEARDNLPFERKLLDWAKRVRRSQETLGRGRIPITHLLLLWEREHGRCRYLGCSLQPGVNASVDHIVPISKGGDHSFENLALVHKNVNMAKLDLDHEDFIAMCRIVASRFPNKDKDNVSL